MSKKKNKKKKKKIKKQKIVTKKNKKPIFYLKDLIKCITFIELYTKNKKNYEFNKQAMSIIDFTATYGLIKQ